MSENEKKLKIGVIGCGEMGSSLAIKLGQKHQVFLCDKSFEKAEKLAKQSHATAVKTIGDLIKHVEIIVLAFKPHDLGNAAAEFKESLKHTQLLISILAGTPLVTLKHYFKDVQLLRMMPNLALKYGQGVMGLTDDGNLSHEKKQMIESLFSPLGMLYWLSEDKLDALTALTASGPAFVFVMVEAMVDAAIAMGFPAAQAQQMVLQMITGSVTLLTETKKHPGELKWQVSSPAGTTIEGLNRLEQDGVRSGIIQAFLAAYNRAKQLSKRA